MRSTPQRWFSWFVFLSFAVILAVAGTAAAGRDLGLLADTLSSNFFAQKVSTICSADNPRFQQNAIGKLGDASAYASLVKREIVMNLPASEAEGVGSRSFSERKVRGVRASQAFLRRIKCEC